MYSKHLPNWRDCLVFRNKRILLQQKEAQAGVTGGSCGALSRRLAGPSEEMEEACGSETRLCSSQLLRPDASHVLPSVAASCISPSLSPHPKTGFPGEPELCHIDCLWPLELTAAFFRLVTESCREQGTGSPWLLRGQRVPHIHPALSSRGGKWLHAMNISEWANELNP